MARTDLVCCLIRQCNFKLSRVERLLVETKLFTLIYHELSKFFKAPYSQYQRLIKSNLVQEENMLGANIMQEMIKDILSTEEYSLVGIATYTQIPEEVLSDIVTGINVNPTFELSRKLFELHISVRRNLYDEIMKKIALEYLEPEKKRLLKSS